MPQLVDVVIPPLFQAYTYALPDELLPIVDVGFEVEVPLGKRNATGFVISKSTDQDAQPNLSYEVKEVVKVSADYPYFDPSQIGFFQWVADYYGVGLGNVIDVALPHAVSQKFSRYVRLTDAQHTQIRGKLQKRIIELLETASGGMDYSAILRKQRGAGPALKRLEALGVVTIDSSEILDHHVDHTPPPQWAKTEVDLNEPQTHALNAIVQHAREKKFQTTLLYGVTGSGKTEVYIEAMSAVVGAGMGALVLVPEIALTPQLIDRFRARLGNDIAVLHSGLDRRARWDSWRALLEKRHFIAIGARSGVFAPVPNLGLIIVDEEHDSSYKQAEGLRYNARDLAVVRGKFHNCPVVLGSATPSLESYYNAAAKRYIPASLPLRHSAAAPATIELVDLNKLRPRDMLSKNISPQLHQALKEVLARGEQAFILYNRRGFASYLQCEKCEAVVECPNCSVTFTYHQNRNRLLCHYCNLSIVPPEFCTNCSRTDSTDTPDESGNSEKYLVPGLLVQRGAGTERIYDEVRTFFPDSVVDRLDRDVANNVASYRDILDRVRDGVTSILVGTQMIAKGHDLPNVTLVGVVDCDVGLHFPDFRAGERVFQLLTQASGRAGRATKPGRVILQTRVPKHLSIVKTLQHDYEGYAKAELQSRAALGDPPFTRILRIIVSAGEQHTPGKILAEFKTFLEADIEANTRDITILGPTPAPLEKLKTEWRWHLLLKCKSATPLIQVMNELKARTKKRKGVKILYDLDPQDLL